MLGTRRLTAAVGAQKRIALASLLRLHPTATAYAGLPAAVAAELAQS
ncbi:isochorismate synthase EntC [Crossiella equi]|uniref:Isochorismate synthase EntC n=1 Tax=Crossiella equi TaxID=130796 RepID=A0ABS5A8J9_9PSEU|nr:hypothetical protein [Crossiella equi]MBP2472933.1 isochorismate synthase EntC [Crossiella equi]